MTLKDFYLSAFLVSQGWSCKGLTKIKENLTLFEFDDNDEITHLVGAYYSNKALVDPLIYGATMRQLKDVMHNINTSNHLNNYVNNKQSLKK